MKVTRIAKNPEREIPAAPSGADRAGNQRQSMSESTPTGSGESFAELYEQSLKTVKEGEVVRGKVLSMDEDFVQIDIGFKSEGLVATWEFMDDDGTILVSPGDEVDVLLEESEDANGRIVLSKEKADRLKIWDEISRAYKADEPVEGTIVARVKGGLAVDIGVKAFLPGSQVDLRPVRNLENIVNQKLKVQDHQVQQAAREHRAVAPRAARDRTQAAARDDARDAGSGPDHRRRDQEPDRLRRVHRSRRHRRPAPRDRHVLGAGEPPERAVPGR